MSPFLRQVQTLPRSRGHQADHKAKHVSLTVINRSDDILNPCEDAHADEIRDMCDMGHTCSCKSTALTSLPAAMGTLDLLTMARSFLAAPIAAPARSICVCNASTLMFPHVFCCTFARPSPPQFLELRWKHASNLQLHNRTRGIPTMLMLTSRPHGIKQPSKLHPRDH
jgi:hypothetical protein